MRSRRRNKLKQTNHCCFSNAAMINHSSVLLLKSMNKEKNISIKLPLLRDYSNRTEWEGACWEKISESEALLQSFVTPNERHEIVMRIAAVEGLFAGKSYRKIAEELWLSPQTISSIKKSLTEKGYRSYPGRNERKKRVYSSIASGRRRPKGRPKRTKYGTMYMPY